MKIFIIDDNAEDRKAFLRALRKAGIDDVTAFSNPLAAYLELADSAALDVAIIDVYLGRDHGLSVSKRLRELSPNCRIVYATGASASASVVKDLTPIYHKDRPISDLVALALERVAVPGTA